MAEQWIGQENVNRQMEECNPTVPETGFQSEEV